MSPVAGLKELCLRAPRLSLAAAESLTTGYVQARIGATAGASAYFQGGVTAYTLDQKVRHLGVDRISAEAVNCVSAAVAEQMAGGACALFAADLAVATTGYAEAAPELAGAPPYAWWAVAYHPAGSDRRVQSGRVDCPGADRIVNQQAVAEAALQALVAFLTGLRAARP